MYIKDYIILFIIITIITCLIEKAFILPNILFTFMWCFGAILNLKHFAGIYGISRQTNIYIFISIITFNITYLVCSKCYKVKINRYIHDIKFSSNKLFISNTISYVFMLPILIKALMILNSLKWNLVLMRKFENPQYGLFTPFYAKMWAWIVYPVFMVTVIYTMVLIAHRKVKYKWIIMSIANVGIYTALYGGRTAIVKLVFYFIFGMIICNRDYINRAFRLLKKYGFLFLIVGCLLYLLTKFRSLAGLSVIENALIYFFGSFTYFDVISNSKKFMLLNNERLYGRGFLGFLISPWMYIFQKISKVNNITGEYLIKNVTDNFMMISDKIRYNAMASDLYVFWRDGGVYGIVIGHIFFAWLVVWSRKHAMAYKNMRWYAVYIFIVYILFTSTMLYDLLSIQSGIMLFLLFFYSNKSQIGRKQFHIIKLEK